jgi:hypothetical protein
VESWLSARLGLLMQQRRTAAAAAAGRGAYKQPGNCRPTRGGKASKAASYEGEATAEPPRQAKPL